MSTYPVPDRTSQGLVTRLVTSVFFRQAKVVSNVAIAPALHRIALEGDSLRGVAWLPGDKLQIRLGHGLQTRTYTPIECDPLAGRTAFLAQTLAPGPGSAWVAEAMPGQQVEVMGTRRSLVLDKLDPAHGVVLGVFLHRRWPMMEVYLLRARSADVQACRHAAAHRGAYAFHQDRA